MFVSGYLLWEGQSSLWHEARRSHPLWQKGIVMSQVGAHVCMCREVSRKPPWTMVPLARQWARARESRWETRRLSKPGVLRLPRGQTSRLWYRGLPWG